MHGELCQRFSCVHVHGHVHRHMYVEFCRGPAYPHVHRRECASSVTKKHENCPDQISIIDCNDCPRGKRVQASMHVSMHMSTHMSAQGMYSMYILNEYLHTMSTHISPHICLYT